MTRWMTLSVAVLFVAAVNMQAENAANAPAPAPAVAAPVPPVKKAVRPPPLPPEPINLTGKLSKDVKTIKDKAGVEKTMTHYVATTADGAKVVLMPNKSVTAEILDGMVDKSIKVTGTGRTFENGGKKLVRLMTLTSVEVAPATTP